MILWQHIIQASLTIGDKKDYICGKIQTESDTYIFQTSFGSGYISADKYAACSTRNKVILEIMGLHFGAICIFTTDNIVYIRGESLPFPSFIITTWPGTRW